MYSDICKADQRPQCGLFGTAVVLAVSSASHVHLLSTVGALFERLGFIERILRVSNSVSWDKTTGYWESFCKIILG